MTKPKRGRPNRKEVNVREVRRLAMRGLTKEQVAGALGMSKETFYVRIRENPDISDAYDEGKMYGIGRIANVVFEKAAAGNVDAAKFFLKCRAGWREGLELTGEGGGDIKHVILNRAMTPEEWESHYGSESMESKGRNS